MDVLQKNQDDVYSRMKNLNSSLNQVVKDLQSSSEHERPGELDSLSSSLHDGTQTSHETRREDVKVQEEKI